MFCSLIKCFQELKFRVVKNNLVQDKIKIPKHPLQNHLQCDLSYLALNSNLPPAPLGSFQFPDQPPPALSHLLAFAFSTWTMIFLTNIRRFTKCQAQYIMSFNAPRNPMRYLFPNFTHDLTEAQRGHMTCQ